MAYSFRHIAVIRMRADPVSSTCVVNPVNCISTNCIIYLLMDWIKIQVLQLIFRASGLVRSKALEGFHFSEPWCCPPSNFFSPSLFKFEKKNYFMRLVSRQFLKKSPLLKILIIFYISVFCCIILGNKYWQITLGAPKRIVMRMQILSLEGIWVFLFCPLPNNQGSMRSLWARVDALWPPMGSRTLVLDTGFCRRRLSLASCLQPKAKTQNAFFLAAYPKQLPYCPKGFSVLVWGANPHTSSCHFTESIGATISLILCLRLGFSSIWVQRLYVGSELRKLWKRTGKWDRNKGDPGKEHVTGKDITQ